MYGHKNGQISGGRIRSLETLERESKCMYASLMHTKGLVHISGESLDSINVWKKH